MFCAGQKANCQSCKVCLPVTPMSSCLQLVPSSSTFVKQDLASQEAIALTSMLLCLHNEALSNQAPYIHQTMHALVSLALCYVKDSTSSA